MSHVLFNALNEHRGWTPAAAPQGTSSPVDAKDGKEQARRQLRATQEVSFRKEVYIAHKLVCEQGGGVELGSGSQHRGSEATAKIRSQSGKEAGGMGSPCLM